VLKEKPSFFDPNSGVYKIPIEFAMLEIVNFIVLLTGVFAHFPQPREKFFFGRKPIRSAMEHGIWFF